MLRPDTLQVPNLLVSGRDLLPYTPESVAIHVLERLEDSEQL